MFKLDNILEKDSITIYEHTHFLLQLHKNAIIPWFILVPKTTQSEVYLCDPKFRQMIHNATDHYASIIQTEFKADKLNIASIGNIVNQLHVHIIARYQNDPFWPNPVWGQKSTKTYKESEIKQIKYLLNSDNNKYI